MFFWFKCFLAVLSHCRNDVTVPYVHALEACADAPPASPLAMVSGCFFVFLSGESCVDISVSIAGQHLGALPEGNVCCSITMK